MTYLFCQLCKCEPAYLATNGLRIECCGVTVSATSNCSTRIGVQRKWNRIQRALVIDTISRAKRKAQKA